MDYSKDIHAVTHVWGICDEHYICYTKWISQYHSEGLLPLTPIWRPTYSVYPLLKRMLEECCLNEAHNFDDPSFELFWDALVKAGAVQIVVKLATTLYENTMVSAGRFICCIGCVRTHIFTTPIPQWQRNPLDARLKLYAQTLVGWSIRFDEVGRKYAVTLGAVAVFVPYLSHVDARVMAYGTAALIR